MALTRTFKTTIMARAQLDVRFRRALLTEALNGYLTGESDTGKAMLRDLINATLGFEALAVEVGRPSKSLHRMLGPKGNPSATALFAIIQVLERANAVRLKVTASAA